MCFPWAFFVIDSSGNARQIFANAERQSDWYTKRIVVLVVCFACSVVFIASITISTILSAKGVGPDEWMVPYKAMYFEKPFFIDKIGP